MRALAAAAAAALVLGGCTTGSVDDVEPGETAVELQVESYLSALAQNKPDRACSKLTENYRQTFAPSCEAHQRQLSSARPLRFEGQPIDTSSIDNLRWSVDVNGPNATVVGHYGETQFKLRKSPQEGWQIDSIEPVRG